MHKVIYVETHEGINPKIILIDCSLKAPTYSYNLRRHQDTWETNALNICMHQPILKNNFLYCFVGTDT